MAIGFLTLHLRHYSNVLARRRAEICGTYFDSLFTLAVITIHHTSQYSITISTVLQFMSILVGLFWCHIWSVLSLLVDHWSTLRFLTFSGLRHLGVRITSLSFCRVSCGFGFTRLPPYATMCALASPRAIRVH